MTKTTNNSAPDGRSDAFLALQLPSAKGGEVLQQVTASRGGANRHADRCAGLQLASPGTRDLVAGAPRWKSGTGRRGEVMTDEDGSAALSSEQDA